MSSYTVKPVQKPLLGHVLVPGDKSIAHRAILFSSLTRHGVRVGGMGAGADNRRSAQAMRAMGVSIEQEQNDDGRPGDVIITGAGLNGLRPPARDLQCGNSGTTMRLLAGLIAGQSFSARLIGDESLHRRPMLRIIEPLARMGATITGTLGNQEREMYPPLNVMAMRGRLSPVAYTMPIASAQVKSAILLASLFTDGVTTITEPGPSRDHSERLLAAMGAPIEILDGDRIQIDTSNWNSKLAIERIDIPGDPSQAAFVLAAGLLAGAERVTVGGVCINDRRTGFLDVLSNMGALVERESMELDRVEPIADLSISRADGHNGRATLSGTIIEGALTVRSLDELPLLAVVAARASGVTEIRDAAELRVKESDRITRTAAMLRAFGVQVEEHDDGMVIEGDPDRAFTSARVSAHGDHRIAMSAAVAGLVADGPVHIEGAECVDTSFPTFVDVMRSLGANIDVSE